MESHKHYTQSETEYLLSCAETDENELLDYEEFVERFHEPAKVSNQKTQTDYIFESSHQDSGLLLNFLFVFFFLSSHTLELRIFKNQDESVTDHFIALVLKQTPFLIHLVFQNIIGQSVKRTGQPAQVVFFH